MPDTEPRKLDDVETEIQVLFSKYFRPYDFTAIDWSNLVWAIDARETSNDLDGHVIEIHLVAKVPAVRVL